MPKTAVIIPVYNHEKYISSTMESVLNQTTPPDHIFVIDDGSSDNSAEIVRGFAESSVDFEVQENAGAHNTLNRLVEKAYNAGVEYVAILNSDDLYLPNRLAACLRAIEQHPDKAIFSTELEIIDDHGAPLASDHPRAKWFRAAWSAGDLEGISLPEWLGRANFIATTSNVVAKTEYLKANPFRDYRYAHDYYFLSAAAIRDQIHLIREPHLQYRVHGSNTITTAPEPLIREMVRIHLDLYAGLAGELLDDPVRRRRFTSYCRTLWENISAFDAGLFQVAAARLLAEADDDSRRSVTSSLVGEEMDAFPNRQLVNSFDDSKPLGDPNSGIAGRLDSVLKEQNEAKSASKANAELARARACLTASRWIALGNLIGFSRKLTQNAGKSPAEKLEKLKSAISSSRWLSVGAKLGSKSSKKLLEI